MHGTQLVLTLPHRFLNCLNSHFEDKSYKHFEILKSDDKTLKIWRTLDWSLEKSIEEPFKQCNGTTHVLRLNWSPDGQLILSAHAINNGAPTAQVIERNNKWKATLDFVGHRKAVTTVVRIFKQIH